MPSKAKRIDRELAEFPLIQKALVAHFLIGPITGEAINLAGVALKKALIEATLGDEPTHHMGTNPRRHERRAAPITATASPPSLC